MIYDLPVIRRHIDNLINNGKEWRLNDNSAEAKELINSLLNQCGYSVHSRWDYTGDSNGKMKFAYYYIEPRENVRNTYLYTNEDL